MWNRLSYIESHKIHVYKQAVDLQLTYANQQRRFRTFDEDRAQLNPDRDCQAQADLDPPHTAEANNTYNQATSPGVESAG